MYFSRLFHKPLSSIQNVFSDVDIKISLLNNVAVDTKDLLADISDNFDGIFGYKVHNNHDNDVMRLCLDNGWRFDLTFA